MPTLDQHLSHNFIKLLVVGDSKSGKTGALASLVCAGYHLGILDMDNLLDPLRTFIERQCPDKLSHVHYITLRDEYKPTPDGPMIKGNPKAFISAIKMMDNWKTDDEDLGPPADWGPDWIFVLDSLSRFCDAAYDFREPLTPRGKSGQYDARATYGDAQDAVEKTLANLTSEGFRTNVIVIGHLSYMSVQDPSGAERIKAFPQGIGQKLSPKIPQYFPSVVHFYNNGGKRTLRTNSTPLLDLANPKPFEMSKEYPIESGLADFFGVLRDPPQEEVNGQPTHAGRESSTTLIQPRRKLVGR